MRQQHAGYQVVPYPKIRRWMVEMFRTVQHKRMMHGLIEADVTSARAALREHETTTGESLSFTAFLITCLAKAVDEHKEVQAIRKGSNRLVLFDDVDVWAPIEHTVAGQKQVVPSIIRAANRKTVREAHQEIRAAQMRGITRASRQLRFLPSVLFRPYFWLFSWRGRRDPRVWKKSVGTVGLTAVGMFANGAGWGIPIPTPTLTVTVGGISEKPGAVDGRIALREYLSLTISFDHELVDGAPAARFTRRFRELIESGYGLDAPRVEPDQARMEGAPQQAMGAALI
jgi:pyruvate/2-oxoglutarate dehydrogenase complex dihydrolipoamide acyltransferase (E2) component